MIISNRSKVALLILLAIGIIALSVMRVVTSPFIIHPEVIDRYPKYFQVYEKDGLILGGVKMAFDSCNGEACVPDRLTANLCTNPKVCESRSRNFNYLVDYIDAIFLENFLQNLA